MSGFNENDNEFYTIPVMVIQQKISNEEIEKALDNQINQTQSEAEEILLVMYILQLMYRSGHRETCTKDVHEKYQLLVTDRLLQGMVTDGLIEEEFDTETLEPVYSLKNIEPEKKWDSEND